MRDRADLETLINTSPVGVVVFDAMTGTPVSFNREARRIVDGLRDPGQSPEQLMWTLSFRRAGGREISLEGSPLTRALSTGETVRVEQILMRVPDGRSVYALLNATPILSDEGEVDSVVVTLQDMIPVKQMKRMRTEFLGVDSHELLTPFPAIKGSAASALGSAFPLSVAEMNQFFRIVNEQADDMRWLIRDLLDVTQIESETLPVALKPADVAALVVAATTAFPRSGTESSVEVDLQPDLPRVMADQQRIVQALGNLLSNASRHSPDSSVIGVSAAPEDAYVAVSVVDHAQACPPSVCRTCSGSFPAPGEGRATQEAEERAWASRSARG